MDRASLTTLAATLLAAYQTVRPADDAARQLLEADRRWAEVAATGEVREVLNLWTEDAVNYFPGEPPAVGREAIGKLVRTKRALPGFSVRWKAADASVAQSGELGYTHGSFTLSLTSPDGKKIQRRGNYVCVWRKQEDGSWKCELEMSNFPGGDARQPN